MTKATIKGHVNEYSTLTAKAFAGYPGMTIKLLSSSGQLVATAVSNSAGAFSFTGLAAGTYQLEYVLPDGLVILPGSTGVNSSTLKSAQFKLTAGQTYSAAAADVVPVARVTGQVVLAGSGEAGVTVELLSATGMLVATTTTNSSGQFSFGTLSLGSYEVRYLPPTGQGLLAGGPASTVTGVTSAFTLVQGEVETLARQTLATGAAAPVDPVMALTAHLTFDDEFNSFSWSANGSVGWMTTYPYQGESQRALPANGEAEYYSDPSVGIDPFSIKDGVLDITATVAPAGSNPYNLPYISGLITTYKSIAQTYGFFEANVELPSGQGLWPAFWLLPDTVVYDSELDIFEVLCNASGTLYFTLHSEVNGVWSAKTLTLQVANTSTGFHTYGVDWEPTVTTLYIDGNVVASQPTPATMDLPMYMLLNLAVGAPDSWPGPPSSSSEFPATYQINYVRAYATANTVGVKGTDAIMTAGITGQVLLGGSGLGGVAVRLLNAAGSVIATTSTLSDGSYSFAKLASGNYQIGYTAPAGTILQDGSQADTSTGLTSAFTLSDGQTLALPAETLAGTSASVSGSVDYAGKGQAGVVVELLAANGSVTAKTTTDSAGDYSFAQPSPGTYAIAFVMPAGKMLQFGGPADLLTGQTAPFTVATGKDVSLATETLVALTPTLVGKVVADGTGEAGVSVALVNAAGQVVATATTPASGEFVFSGLAPGSYQIRYKPPSGTMLETGSAASTVTGQTAPVSLAAGQVRSLAEETVLTNPAWISAHTVLVDPTAEYGYDPDASVTVQLLNATGSVIATTVSDQQGWFAFTGIAAGNYQLQYTPPAGQSFAPDTVDDPLTGLTPVFSVAAGALTEAPFAYFTGAATISGTVQAEGVALASVTVSLFDASGDVLATATPDANGGFSFVGLGAGSYRLGYTAPKGVVAQIGGTAAPATGLSGLLSVTAGQTLSVPLETLVSNPANIQGSVAHFGGATDPVYGTGEAGVAVSLLDGAGNVLASTVTNGQGWYIFRDIGAGTYEMLYTPPAGQIIKPGSTASAAGVTAAFTVGTPAGQSVQAPQGELVSGFTMTGSGLSITQGNGSYIVTGTASASTLTLGTGNQSVTLTGGADTVVTGSGNQTISLSGTANSITVGTGVSTIQAGSGEDTVHAAGGRVTISATGGGNLFDAGAGIGFLNADGSAGNVFMLNAGGAALLTTITGFNPAAHDILDLHRTLAGTAVLANLSNVGSFVTAAYSGGNTVLSMTPTGGTTQTFAVLDGVHTTVAALLAAGDFSLT